MAYSTGMMNKRVTVAKRKSDAQGPRGPQGPPGIGGEQSDWNETDPSAGSYIKNKPTVYTQQQTDAMVEQGDERANTRDT